MKTNEYHYRVLRTEGHCPSLWGSMDVQLRLLELTGLLGLALQGSLVKTIIISYNTHQDFEISQCESTQTKQNSCNSSSIIFLVKL